MGFTIRQAQPEDCATIGRFIRLIAEYEKMSDEVVWDDATLYDQLFVERRAEVLLGEEDGQVVGFALYFHNFSTFVGRKGFVSGRFVRPAGKTRPRLRQSVLQTAGGNRRRAPLWPDGMGMPQLERSVDRLLSKSGRRRPDGMDDLAAKRRQDPSAGWIVSCEVS